MCERVWHDTHHIPNGPGWCTCSRVSADFRRAAYAVAVPARPRDPFDAARDVTRRHARSFYFASPFLPRDKRRRAFAVYALCRRLDDAVDEAPSPEAAVAEVAAFGETLDRVYGNDPLDDDVLEAARQTVAVASIPRRYFDELAAGVEQDLTVTRYADEAEQARYCYLVAGVVGLIMCRVFDLQDADAEPRAIAMGNAMQVTNILRDVKEDWQRGRLYLPQSTLARFDVTESQIDAMTNGQPVSGNFGELMKHEVARARSLYREGFAGLPALALDGSRQTAATMAVIYGGILGAIKRAQYDVFTARRRLTLSQKLLRLPAARRLARRGVIPAAFVG